ncbi:MAG: hypothetical protein ACOZAA_01205 [Pseudomonadota bacterium]
MFADNWCIKANERIYGPYSSGDLRKFAHEGRFAPWSLIAPAGSRDFKEARMESAFAQFFGAGAPAKDARAFGKSDGSDPETAVIGAETARTEPRRARPIGPLARSNPSTDQMGLANFVIIFDVVNAAASRVENALASLGTAFRLAENVWAVSCALTAIGVRNAIAPYLKPHESLFVVDTTNGRTSWQNYAPEAHAKITQAFVHSKR